MGQTVAIPCHHMLPTIRYRKKCFNNKSTHSCEHEINIDFKSLFNVLDEQNIFSFFKMNDISFKLAAKFCVLLNIKKCKKYVQSLALQCSREG
jgi:hypothetical protein